MDENGPGIYKFGPFEIDLKQRLLLGAGNSVPLTPKAFDTLAVLVARRGKIVDKAELLKLVWPDTFVEQNNLTQNISALRKVLGEGDYTETIPRRGYRFLMEIESVAAPEASTAASEPEPLPASVPKRRSLWIWGMVSVAAAAAFVLYVSHETQAQGGLEIVWIRWLYSRSSI